MTLIKILAFPAFKNKNSNPYNYLLYSGIEALDIDVKEFSFLACLRLKYDVIHVHWPELYLNSHYALKAFCYSVLFLFSLCIAKLCGKKIIWTVHNLKPHHIKYPLLNRYFWLIYLRLVDGFISLSHANEQLFLDEFKELQCLPRVAIHHGLYSGFYDDSVTKMQARQKLGIPQEQNVNLFMGQIKGYKNIDTLIELFSSSPQLQNHILIIAGKFESQSYYQEVAAKTASTSNIIIHNKFIPNNELQFYFRAADLCILPFNNIFNSGSVLLSVSFNTPVLVPESPNFAEYAMLLQKGLIRTYRDQLTPELILSVTATNKELGKDCETISWGYLQEKMARFYNSIVNKKPLFDKS